MNILEDLKFQLNVYCPFLVDVTMNLSIKVDFREA